MMILSFCIQRSENCKSELREGESELEIEGYRDIRSERGREGGLRLDLIFCGCVGTSVIILSLVSLDLHLLEY